MERDKCFILVGGNPRNFIALGLPIGLSLLFAICLPINDRSTAQNPPNPGEIDKIRQRLLLEPVIKLKLEPVIKLKPGPRPKRTYSPGLGFAGIGAFGANTGDVFIGASAATAGNRGNSLKDLDGSMSAGFGLGDSLGLVGLEFTFNNGSVKNFGSNGTFDLKAHRIVHSQGTNTIGVALGWKTFGQFKTKASGEAIRPSSAYAVATSYSLLRANDPVNNMPISFSLGVGGGDFRQGNDSIGVFGGAGVQVHPQIGVGLGWSGVGINVGASFVPAPTLPLTVTTSVSDLTNNSPGGTVFSLSVGYGFNFLPK
ncbi:hypothetical protein [Cylindrospermopsis raciborskii]|uniref:hypothetical protein n=1 Tax=Cylindrospermopsis raciborskii TaxID=77022 RepID=UPI0038D0AD84